MSAPLKPVLPDPRYQNWVEQNIQKLRKAGFTDQEIRTDWLMGEQGMADTTASKFIAPPPPPPPPSPDALSTVLKLGTAALPGGANVEPGDLKNLAGMGLSAVRGATLGASDYATDRVPAVKQLMDSFRHQNPGTALAMEMSGGLVNPFKWLKGVPGLKTVGEFMAPGATEVKSGLKAAVGRVAKTSAQAGIGAGIYGFNTADGSLGDRALSGGASALGGMALGAGIGTALAIPENMAATRAMRAETGLSPKSRDIIAEAQKVQGGLRDPATFHPGEMLIDNAGPLEKSLVHEALRRSPEALAEVNALKAKWVAAQKDAPTGLAMEIAGVQKDFPNPIILARDLRAQGRAAAQPLYNRLSRDNPIVPRTPELDVVLKNPSVQGFLTSPSFRRFAANQSTADELRGMRGGVPRGDVMDPKAIAAALAGENPKVATTAKAVEGVLGTPLTPEQMAQVRASLGATPTPEFDWRTLNYAKMAMDRVLFPKAGFDPKVLGSLGMIDRGNLLEMRTALVDAMKAMPEHGQVYAQALDQFAGGQASAEMLEAGRAAARKGASEAEALLADPKVLALGESAVRQARFGILAELHDQLSKAAVTSKLSGDVWTDDRVKMLKMVATTPEQAATAQAFIESGAKRYGAFDLAPDKVPGIQTRGGEQMEGATAGALASFAAGTGVGFRVGNALQRVLGKMSPKEAFEIARTYYSGNPTKAMSAVIRPFTRDASRVGNLSGIAAGNVIGGALSP